MKLKLTALSIILSTTINVNANGFFECRKIENNSERLSCYDGFIDAQNQQEKLKSKDSLELKEKEPLRHVENFGLKTKIEESQIVSNIEGELRGWDKTTKFKLANGQVWKVANSTVRTYVSSRPLDSPKVTIEKGILGSHIMKISGLSKKVKVKRVK